ncbi:zinc finger CCCH domain-containing protein 18 [Neltuma alba]|uniref:zinc finger CCCH domain-containing protein 18 n=1 Tax=Neltuma alba TaxID=207710 RepID=UPI0010A32968|nr:zinc finger CCCH domain-containing protein 18-like [Prosopis alba]XP_028777857.1 zinc finger CCCH domain-containing protein 18-like [Prosopis alba]XP_028777858.1 zinc finger CCCH domain-containing protein 18-like [Prosopis alba]
MDISDHTRIVFDRIQKFDAEHATKIIGYLLLQDHGEQEMAKLASCPDHVIRDVAFKTKMELQRLSSRSSILPVPPPLNSAQHGLSQLSMISSRSPTSPANFPAFWEPQSNTNTTNTDFMPMSYLDSMPELQKQTQLFGLENNMAPVIAGNSGIVNDYYSLDTSPGNLNAKAGRRFSSEFPVKTCHYFNKGFCKHGSSCRYYHGQVGSERLSQMFGNDASNDDQLIPPGSLAQLESEIVELLKSRRGNPITIASLPMAYYEKYKKVLQADGYLTESQRHGKSGYSLTKLLARLKNAIRVIDRPHGQHAVVLAEDAPKYLERGDPGQNISAARQIYLTFPADCSFTEEDVSNYFSNFGTVEDVRIPCQQRRMFGFVTFTDPETVKTVLDKGNPHYVQGSRVLVKPYREKSKIIDRKHPDRIEPPVCYSPQYADIHSELTSMSRSFGDPQFLRRQFCEEQEQALEFQRRRFAELQLNQNPAFNPPYPGFSMDGLKASRDPFNFQPTESLNYTAIDKPRYIKTNSTDEDGQGLDLPDSPFAFPTDSGISAAI